MGWFGSSSPSKVSAVTQVPAAEQPQYLEDLPPKFEDKETAPVRPEATVAGVLPTVKLADFAPANMVMIPCFRDAMLTGFSAMGVLGVVTFLIHKNAAKAFNWSVGGFFLGNIVGWEQCRSIRRKSFHTMERARQLNQEKNKKKLETLASGDGVEEWERRTEP
ncbi:Cytochrome c oxidase assembly protein COX20, mitochondrial [[Candida] zeylanoides]